MNDLPEKCNNFMSPPLRIESHLKKVSRTIMILDFLVTCR